MTDPISEGPAPDDVLAAFLERYWKDREEGELKPLSHHLLQFPDHEDLIAHEYMALQEAAAPSEPGTPEDGADLGPYRIVEELGRGGQGIVYKAEDTRLNRFVALKVLTALGPGSEETVLRFRREAEVASKLNHPGICGVHDAGVANGVPYIDMQLISGKTFAQHLAMAREDPDTRGDYSFFDDGQKPETPAPDSRTTRDAQATSSPINRSEIMRLVGTFEKAARALHAAHEAGIVHRDIKPGNVMVTEDGDPVILDFGLARDDQAGFQELTRTGDMFGTPAYMSPEQLMGQRLRLDRRTDVYSLGATLYECLTLRRVFEAPTREALYQAIMTDDPPDARERNPAIPKDLRVVLDAALEKNRDRRYQTSLAFAEDLLRVQRLEPVAAQPIGPIGKVVRWAQRRPYRAASLLLVLGAVATGTWWVATAGERRAVREEALRARVDRLLEEGYLELGEGSVEKAHELFRSALKLDAGNPEAVAGRAMALMALGYPARAVSFFAAQDAIVQRHPELRWVKADALRRAGNVADADAVEAGLGKPATPLAWFILGLRAMDRGHAAMRRSSLGRPLPSNSPADDSAFHEAIGLLRQAVMGGEAKPLYVFELAHAIGHTNDHEAAVQIAAALTARWPASAHAWYLAGITLRAARRDAASIEAFETAVSLDPDAHGAWYNLGLARDTAGRFDQAIEAYETALAIRPDDPDAWLNLGILRANHQQRYDAALMAFYEVLDLEAGYANAWFNISAIRVQQQRYEDAVEAWNEGLKLDPVAHGWAWRNYGDALRGQEKHDDAIDAYRRSLALDPDDPATWLNLGLILFERQEWDESVEAYERAIQADPGSADAWNNLGTTWSRKGEHEKATTAYRNALTIKPRMRVAHANLIRSLQDTEHATAALLAEFERWAGLHPHDAIAWNDYAFALLKAGRRGGSEHAGPEVAVAAARRAVSLTNEQDPEMLNILALALHADHEPRAAMAVCDKALKLIEQQQEPDLELRAKLEASLRRFKRAAGNQ